MKNVMTTIGVFIIVVGIPLLWSLPAPSYHYVGIEKMSLDNARQMQINESSSKGDNIQIMAYDNNADDIYVSYNFRGYKKDAKLYGIPEVEERVDYLSLIFATLGIIFVGGFMIIVCRV
jgi:hypothetical protein